ncbi:MAG: adenylate/guanylate cyclase domain-containing protein [Myxococcota bacterium]
MPRFHRPFPALLAALVVAAIVLLLRSLGGFERLDLALYDAFLKRLPVAESSDVLLVEITEQDIRDEGHWPISDRRLGEVLEILVASPVRAVGLDLYRDLPVTPGVQFLRQVLRDNPEIVAVYKFGDPDDEGIPGPKILTGSGRIGFNDLLADPFGESIRRVSLFMSDDEGNTQTSFAMLLAAIALSSEGIAPAPHLEQADWMQLGETPLPPLDAQHGGYRDLDARGYQMMLDYGAPDRFESVTLGEVLAGGIDPARLRDRVAIVGASAKSLRDELPVPLGGRRAGMEIHGQIVDQLIRMAHGQASVLRVLGEWPEAAAVVVVGFLGSLVGLGSWRRPLLGTGALLGIVLTGVLVLLAFAYWAFRLGWWIPVAAPTAAWLGTAGVLTAWVSSRERSERNQLMNLFARHVSPSVADEIWERSDEFLADGRPLPQRLEATVMFVDMKGYTGHAEHMDPAELMEWVNEFMERMAEEIEHHGGVIDDYFGDGIKANFGVPVPRSTDEEVSQDACRAAQSALALGRVLEELNAAYRLKGLPECAIRVGLHTGTVVAGSLGSADRLKYTVVGDVVVTAQRLEATDAVEHDYAANPCRILASEQTCQHLGPEFETESLEPVQLKGKKKNLPVRRLTGCKGV